MSTDKNTPGPWVVRVRRSRPAYLGGPSSPDADIVDCFVQAPDVHGYAYDAEVLGDDEYREADGMVRKLADCQLIAQAIEMRRLLRLAEELYTNYGLVAGTYGEPGKWVGDVRDLLDKLDEVPR